jgi:hypothetical protein
MNVDHRLIEVNNSIKSVFINRKQIESGETPLIRGITLMGDSMSEIIGQTFFIYIFYGLRKK